MGQRNREKMKRYRGRPRRGADYGEVRQVKDTTSKRKNRRKGKASGKK